VTEWTDWRPLRWTATLGHHATSVAVGGENLGGEKELLGVRCVSHVNVFSSAPLVYSWPPCRDAVCTVSDMLRAGFILDAGAATGYQGYGLQSVYQTHVGRALCNAACPP